jgi:hypothetical protein
VAVLHNFNRTLRARFERLVREWARIPIPPTEVEVARADARRKELVTAALEGRRPNDLRDGDEAQRFDKIRGYAPIFQELIDDGILDADTGQPVGPPAPDHDDQGDEDAATRP